MPVVSVILPTCDRPDLVGRALASVLAQTGLDFEVVLVDSNRRAPPVRENSALATLRGDPRVRLLEPTPRPDSAARARNAGLAAARGEWITYLDDDDEYRPDKLAAQFALATKTGSPLVLCGYTFRWPHRSRDRQTGQASFAGDALITEAFLGTGMLFHRRTPGLWFDERLRAGEDRPFALQLIWHHGLQEVPSVPRSLVVVHPQRVSVHKDTEAVWVAYLASLRLARRLNFSRAARRRLLLRGRIERAIGGWGRPGQLLASLVELLRSEGWRAGRFAVFALVARLSPWRGAVPGPEGNHQ